MAGRQYSAASLYTQVLLELGARSVDTAQTTAIRNRIADALTTVWHDAFWSWRKRRFDLTFTVATPYSTLPTDWDGFSLSRLYRRDSDDGETHSMFMATDEQFERLYYGASSSEPTCFRVTERNTASGTASSIWTTVAEPAPYPDASYTYEDVEYYCSVPASSWSSTAAVDMPPEFHDVWHELALAEAAKVLGQDKKAALAAADGAAKLSAAGKRRDLAAPKGPMLGLSDPYADWKNTRG